MGLATAMLLKRPTKPPNPKSASHPRLQAAIKSVRLEWRVLGGLGRAGLLGVFVAAALAIGLGFRIEVAARSDLLAGRASILSQTVDGLPISSIDIEPGSDEYERLAESADLRLLGAEVVRVKLWAPDGRIVFSDASDLVGRRFDLADDVSSAFSGHVSHDSVDLNGPSNLYEQGLGDLIEFYLPVLDGSGRVVGVFEVYERNAPLAASLSRIRHDVWWSVGLGLMTLGAFVTALLFGLLRSADRRRQVAEDLAQTITMARDDERARIVKALHDDVGQPVYRVLFGLQGCRHLNADPLIDAEMERLEDLTRQIESTLRSELRRLHGSVAQEIGLQRALSGLVKTTKDETDLNVTLKMDHTIDLRSDTGTAVLHAVKESLINIRRHADASSVSIGVRVGDDHLVAEVLDDGVGWNGAEGIGLTTTRQTLEEVNGTVCISRREPKGTSVQIVVPCPTDQP